MLLYDNGFCTDVFIDWNCLSDERFGLWASFYLVFLSKDTYMYIYFRRVSHINVEKYIFLFSLTFKKILKRE